MQILKADTAATILIGPAVAFDDGVTPVTNVTLGGADHAELMKHDGTAFVDLTSDSRTFTHKEGGWYTLLLGTGDTDTEGRLTVVIMDTDAIVPIWKDFMVVNANVFDSLFAVAAADYLQVDALQLGGVTQSATDLKDLADTGYDPSTHKVQGVVLTDTCTANSDMVGTDSAALASVLGAAVGASISADIAAIEAQTDDIGVAGAGLTDLGGMSTGMKAEVESEANDALIANNLDHLCKTVTASADMTTEVVDNTILSRVLANGDTSAFVPSTDGLQLIRDKQTDIETDTAVIGALGAGLTDLGGMSTGMMAEVESEANDALVALNLDHLCKTVTAGADMTTEVVDNTILSRVLASGDTSAFDPTTDSLQDIRDKLTDIETDTGEIGTAGAGLTDLGGMSTGMKAEVEAECTDAIEADGLDHLVSASVAGADITDNSIIAKMVSKDATADWDDFVNTTDALQAIRDKQTDIETDTAVIGTLGAGLTDLGGMSTTMKGQVNTEVDGALNTAIPGSPASNSVNERVKAIDDKLPTNYIMGSSVVTDKDDDIDAILVDTAVIGALGAGLTDLGGMSTTMKGQVNAEVDTALATTTYAEPSGVIAATSTLKDKICWLFTLARNKITQTSTTQTLRNDADDGSIATSTVSDDGTTATRSEFS